MTTSRRIFQAALTLTLASVGLSAQAQAQFAPRLASDDIEGAIMPAIPFPSENSTARGASPRASLPPAAQPAAQSVSADRAPVSMGLAPSAPEDAEPARPQTRSRDTGRRPLSAQETADRLLR